MIGLAPIDGLTVLAIVAKAIEYAAASLAMGGILFHLVFAKLAAPDVLRLAQRIAVCAALIGLTVLALRFGIRAARISGMGLEGATDPVMLGFVWQSPLGTAAIWRAAGGLLIAAALIPVLGRWIALAGSVAVAVSFAQVGHSLGEPRAALAVFLVVHVLAFSVWIGSLIPLHRAARTTAGADLLHQFGKFATYIVALLIIAGVTISWLLAGSIAALLGTAYGAVLLLKVLSVSVLLGVAALNKVRLVPALRADERGAAKAIQRSISTEMLVVALVFVVTAIITVVTTPPVNL
ncbi:MAG: CopD family protein [Pseudomonadota bacterium]